MSKPQPHVPRVGDDPRGQTDEVAEPPGKIWFRDLDEAVIEADRCIQCGSCVAACPSDSIGIDAEENRPTLVRMCTGCSSCWDYCPRSGLRYERVVDAVADERGLAEPRTYAARATDEASRQSGQDGGVVTALLAHLLETGEIDGALVAVDDTDHPGLVTVAEPDAPLEGTAALATTPAAVRASGGSVYNQVMSLGRLDALVDAAGLSDPDLALVGTPCVLEGASALERYDHDAASPIALTVALMCTRNFEHERLAGLLGEHGVDPDAVEKLDVSEGTLFAYDDGGETLLAEDVDSFGAAGLRGCDECADFLGGGADLSVGNVASGDDETTLLVRTERGQRALDRADDALAVDELSDTDALDQLADWNERRAKHFLPREYDPEGSVGISYGEHREAYDGTDRDPDPLNPARVHQYEEWC